MGDMGEFYRDWEELKKQAKKKRLAQAETQFDATNAPIWTRHTPYHWSTELQGKRLDFWPSTGKWRWRNKSYHGTPYNLSRFILNRENND